jgi:hypothetical protein
MRENRWSDFFFWNSFAHTYGLRKGGRGGQVTKWLSADSCPAYVVTPTEIIQWKSKSVLIWHIKIRPSHENCMYA